MTFQQSYCTLIDKNYPQRCMYMVFHQPANSHGNYSYDPVIYTDVKFRPHFHRNFELLYVISGTCSLTVATGQKNLQAGEMFLIPPCAIHSLSVDQNSILWLNIFSGDFVASFTGRYSDILYSAYRCDASVEIFLKENLFNTQTPDRYMAKACLYLACDQCLRHAQKEAKLDFNRIIAITQFITDHLSEDISLQMAADALNVEYHYFSRLFHKLFRMNFRDYVNLYKLDSACEMLTETKLDIGAIARDCGFVTVRSFNRSFKEHTGMTPSQYRITSKKK